MGKLKEMQAQAEETKKRLDNITVVGEAYEGQIKVTMTGNREVRDIHIDPKLAGNAEQLQDMMLVAFNRALEKANNVNETEMQNAAKSFLPGM